MTTTDEHTNEHDDDRASQLRSFLALAFIAAFVALSVWLVTAFRNNNRKIECLEAGHRDCVPFDTTAKGD